MTHSVGEIVVTPVFSPGARLDKDMSMLQLSDLDIGPVLKRYMEGWCQPEVDQITGFSPASRAPIPTVGPVTTERWNSVSPF